MCRIGLLQRSQNGAGLDFNQRRRQPDMWIKPGIFLVILTMCRFTMVLTCRLPILFIYFMIMFGFMVFRFVFIMMLVMSLHGKLFDTMIRMNYLEIGIGCGYFA